MIGALWTGISGLASHQTALDNEAHNIANVNTVGYKSSRIAFADQMYQDKIGKGSKVLDAEKIYEQGNLKVTGVSYDVALSGDGFFTVADKNNGGGTAETYYTRAGNFRMGENGTLQDAAGNEVQGWIMSQIDSDADVVSTNPNISKFTNDYTKLVSSQIVSHATYVETITAKTTDYNTTSKADSLAVFSGAGYKTESGKIADIEELSKAYASALQKYKADPDGTSASAVTQISYIDFQDKAGGILDTDGDIISVYIDNVRYSQKYDTSYENTMKLLANQISAIPGLKAYTVDATLAESTADADVANGILKIESIIPGDSFLVSNVLTESGQTEVNGSVRIADGRDAVAGSGLGALEAVRDKLSEAVSGKQRDVFLQSDLFVIDSGDDLINGAHDFTYEITIWDKDAKANVTVPSAPLNFTALADNADPAVAIAAMAAEINADLELQDYVVAKVVNGALVVETLNSNYDVEFSGIMDRTVGAPIGVIEKNATHSGREGASAEFIEVVNKIDQTSSRDSLQLRLDTLGISDSAFGEFSVDKNGLITMKQDGVSFAIGQLAIAMFNNNRGLEPSGNNLLAKTNDSGDPIYNINNAKAASVQGRTLELSEADLSESLVNLMVFQRAFEANAKSITTSDELLSTLINLKR
jgi:flagellar hook protein FlgE